MLRKSFSHRAGVSLLEVTAASVLLAALLLPSASLMRQSSEHGRRLSLRERMLMVADSLVESQRLAVATGNSAPFTEHGPFSRSGISAADHVHYEVRRFTSTQPELLTIDVQLWQDLNADNRRDVGEPSVHLITQSLLPKR